MKRTVLILALLAVAAAGLGIVAIRMRDGDAPKQTPSARREARERIAGKWADRAKHYKGRGKSSAGNLAGDVEPQKEKISAKERKEKRDEIKALLDDILSMLENPKTEEQRRAVKMRKLLDSGDKRTALHMARDLMDSKDPAVRAECVNVLGWIGYEAMPELTEMLADPEPDVAEAARTEWDLALQEVTDDSECAALIKELVPILETQQEVESVLLKFARMSDSLSLTTLSEIIEDNSGTMAGECARDMYEHLAFGEAYESRSKTEELIDYLGKRARGELPEQQPEYIEKVRQQLSAEGAAAGAEDGAVSGSGGGTP